MTASNHHKRQAELARQTQAGNMQAGWQLLMEYEGCMRKYASRFARRKEHAIEDLVHECMLTLLQRRFLSFNPAKASFMTWVRPHIHETIRRHATGHGLKNRLRLMLEYGTLNLDEERWKRI